MTKKSVVTLAIVALLSAVLLSVVLLSASSVHALTLTNRDAEQHRLQTSKGLDATVSQEIVIAGGETLEDICKQGCIITLENGQEEIFEGDEVVSLENGSLAIDQ